MRRLLLTLGCACLTLACSSGDDASPGSEAGSSGHGITPIGGRVSSTGGQRASGGSGGGGSGGAAGRSSAGSAAGRGGSGSSAGGASGSGSSSGGAKLGECGAFPADDVWNRNIEQAPVSAEWTAHLLTLVGSKMLHPDYGNAGSEHYGIPINVVPQTQPKLPITFDDAEDESDPGPYPFPGADTVRVEGGTATACDGDCHVLVVQAGTCRLYEGYACRYASDGWHCSSGAVWDLTKNSEGQRMAGYTSADAAGLAIAPGLVRYLEAKSGEINHAIRFTLHCTRANYVAPATHQAVPGSCRGNADAPPMGLRVRLKADYDLSRFSGSALAVVRAMQRYGMILADNGSDFYFQGEQDERFAEEDVEPLKTIPADAFEALDPGPLLP
jgi:hypothetical protein